MSSQLRSSQFRSRQDLSRPAPAGQSRGVHHPARGLRTGRRTLLACLVLGLLLPALELPAASAAAEPSPVPAEEFAERRQRVLAALGPNAILVMSAPEAPSRNGDVHWPFRQDDDLYWLTGVAEPDSALVLIPGDERYREVLFARDRDPLSEKWDGPIPEHAELAAVSGIDQVHSAGGEVDLLEAALAGWHWGESELYRYYREPVSPRLLQAVRRGEAEVWLDLGAMGRSRGLRGGATTAEDRLADRVRQAFPGVRVRNVTPLLADLREVKSEAEVAILEHAIDLTEAGIRAGMARAGSAERENQIHASVEHAFRDGGACCWGFPSIVAAGENSTILHYPPAEGTVPRDGLVLLDVGADYAGYTADITRTFPADGTFSAPQREIYQAVLNTWNTLLPRVRPGTRMADLHGQALELLGEELISLGLITRHDPDQVTWYFPTAWATPSASRSTMLSTVPGSSRQAWFGPWSRASTSGPRMSRRVRFSKACHRRSGRRSARRSSATPASACASRTTC